MKLLWIAPLLLAGCAYNMTPVPYDVTLMPRDSGKTYSGTLEAGNGRGTMTMAMDGVSCSGLVARVGSNETFGLVNSFGTNSRGGFSSGSSTIAVAGDVHAKAMLSCSDGSGLRCDITGRPGSAGGVCQDDKGRLFDALATSR